MTLWPRCDGALIISANHNGLVNLASLSSGYHLVTLLIATNMDAVVSQLGLPSCPSGSSAKRVDKPEQAAANPFGVDVALVLHRHCHDWSSPFKSHNSFMKISRYQDFVVHLARAAKLRFICNFSSLCDIFQMDESEGSLVVGQAQLLSYVMQIVAARSDLPL